MLFLGVDGGGTKSSFVLIDGAGNIRAHCQTGCAYYPEVGMSGVARALADGFATILAQARVTREAIDYGFFAIPAYGEDSARIGELDRLPESLLAPEKRLCGNDMVSGWAGAFAAEDGINVVAGTGSIAYGERAGRQARAGGWGELFSDEGSAYWVAREGLNLFSRMSDGRTGRGPLHSIVRRELALSDDLDLCAAVYSEAGALRSQVARYAQIMSEAAWAGDSQVIEIFEKAALELVVLVCAVHTTLGVPAGEILPVSYSGGMFRTPSPILERFAAALTRTHLPFDLRVPRFPPSVGAALYAARRHGTPLDETALSNLTRHCRDLTA